MQPLQTERDLRHKSWAELIRGHYPLVSTRHSVIATVSSSVLCDYSILEIYCSMKSLQDREGCHSLQCQGCTVCCRPERDLSSAQKTFSWRRNKSENGVCLQKMSKWEWVNEWNCLVFSTQATIRCQYTLWFVDACSCVAKKPLVSIFQVCSGAEHVMNSNMTSMLQITLWQHIRLASQFVHEKIKKR